MSNEVRDEIVSLLVRDKVRAHDIVFAKRHPDASAEFHAEIILKWHSNAKQVVTEAFRGGAKSTKFEEVFALEACLQNFKNGLIIGSNEKRSSERLAAVKNELENNEWLPLIFGRLQSAVWGDTKIVLSNGVAIQAIGHNQAMRGTKHLDFRPDLCLIDDYEDEDTVGTEGMRDKLLRRLYRSIIPAMDKNYRLRFIGNRLDPDAVIVRVSKDQNWEAQRFPIMVPDENGESLPDLPPGKWRASWASRFPLKWIAEKRAEYVRLNILRDFNAEFMCEADVPEEKPFRAEMIRVVPQTRVHEPVYAMLEPLPTVKGKPGLTACAVWSWKISKLVVWEAWSRMMMPDEIVSEIERIDDTYRPIALGIEEDALKEFLAQPIRGAQLKRGQIIPHRSEKGRIEKDKPDFIKGLQPFFSARSVEFAKELPELREQLLAAPTGKMEITSALAFAPWLKPVAPFYEDFQPHHIAEELNIDRSATRWLAMNATGVHVTAVLVQYANGIKVLADWICERDGSEMQRILSEASLEAQGKVKPIICRLHNDRTYAGIGLSHALARVPVAVNLAPEPERGRDYLRQFMRQQIKGISQLQVSSQARWTLNALQGGYARALDRRGQVTDEAQEGPYQLLMEGLESFMAQMKATVGDGDRENVLMAHSRDGREYITSLRVR